MNTLTPTETKYVFLVLLGALENVTDSREVVWDEVLKSLGAMLDDAPDEIKAY